MIVDYIIIGCGLAGISFCQQLKKNQKSFVVFDDASQQSSTVAGGLYNPVILKRFTPVWKSKEQLDIALPMYKEIEEELGIEIDYKIPVLRLFNSIEEQNNWFAAADKEGLKDWLSTKIIGNTNNSINANFGFGEVLHTGRIDTTKLIERYKRELNKENRFFPNSLDYDQLKFHKDFVGYNSIKAKHIIFAEGFGLKKNPYFRHLPLTGTKGELLVIHAPDLQLNVVLKSTAFLIPLANDQYIVGATYNWTDKTNTITPEAQEELLNKLNKFMSCDYEVIDHIAAVRPTVKDRRPLVGSHKTFGNAYVLNGLGTRGVMIAPYIAQQLFDHIENGMSLDEEIDIRRFE